MEHDVNRAQILTRQRAYETDAVISKAIETALSYAVSQVVLVQKKDRTTVLRASPDFSDFMQDHITVVASQAFVQYLVHGAVVIAFDMGRTSTGEKVPLPKVIPFQECDLLCTPTREGEIRLRVSRHELRNPKHLKVFMFGEYNLLERIPASRTGAVIRSHNEYDNIITATTAVAVRASMTPLVLQRGNGMRSENAYMSPNDLSVYSSLTGELNSDITNARDAIREYEYQAQERLTRLINIEDNIMNSMKRNNLDPNDPTFSGGLPRMTLPPDTQVARVEYPALPFTPEGMYSRYTDTVFGIYGVLGGARANSRPGILPDRLSLAQSTRVRYHSDMNRFLRWLHDELMVSQKVDPDTHPVTFGLGPPHTDIDDVMTLTQLGFIDRRDIRELMSKAFGFDFRPFIDVAEEAQMAAQAASAKDASAAAEPSDAKKKGEKNPQTSKAKAAGEKRKAGTEDDDDSQSKKVDPEAGADGKDKPSSAGKKKQQNPKGKERKEGEETDSETDDGEEEEEEEVEKEKKKKKKKKKEEKKDKGKAEEGKEDKKSEEEGKSEKEGKTGDTHTSSSGSSSEEESTEEEKERTEKKDKADSTDEEKKKKGPDGEKRKKRRVKKKKEPKQKAGDGAAGQEEKK